ncbi:MAG: helix-turn-helix domain-containing protein [Pyrinomonadaceae bacterium]|nr:helix-turn-helix domain-containing protein [Pyrinomonadaceae bacterium]
MSSLGEKLRQAREARGVSLGEVAEQTRISTHYLEAIESDDYRNLPGGIFNKGFVKAFAKYVGIDEQEALQDYSKIILEQGDKLSEPELKVNRPEVLTDDSIGRTSILPTIIFAAVILGLMTWGILAAINWYSQPESNTVATNTKPANTATTNTASNGSNVNTVSNVNGANTATNTATNTSTETAVSTGELNIQFKSISQEVDKPNVTTTTDGKWESYTFQADEPKVYTPQQSIKIRYSKWQAGNIQMTINGKSIPLPNQPLVGKGQGVEFEINKTNVAKILQSGAITADSVGSATPANANANTATPATTLPKQ